MDLAPRIPALRPTEENAIGQVDEHEPALIFAEDYHDPETGLSWRVMTEWWPEGSFGGQGGSPGPTMPGHVVKQRTVFSDGRTICPLPHPPSALTFEAC